MNIVEAIKDKALFRRFLDPKDTSMRSWANWMICLRLLYGLPINSNEYREELVKRCTGRELSSFTKTVGVGFNEALFLTGRRSGKSRIAAICGAYESILAGKENLMSPGETGVCSITAPSKRQAFIIRKYLRAVFDAPLLENEVVRESKDGFELANGLLIEVLVADFRSIRGFSLCSAILDEAAFLGLEVESRIRSDTELVRALRPSLSTTNGKLISISSPYAKKGYCWESYKKHWGNFDSSVLVWNCDSRTMNPTLSQEIIDAAYKDDPTAAMSEYGGSFRSDISVWLSREVIEAGVVKGRKELAPRNNIQYKAFVDASGGRNDSAVLSLGHIQSEKAIVDFITEFKAPHNPQACIDEMCNILRRWGISRVTGDNYAGEFVSSAFVSNSIAYEKCEKSASDLYLEILGQLCSFNVELLDNETLINQLSSLERRTRSGGKDKVTHPDGGHDDVANSVAGLVYILKEIRVGTVGAFLRAR